MTDKQNHISRDNPVKTLEVCLSPALLANYSQENKVVVVIDIFRASSAICTAFDYGVRKIFPVETVKEAREYKKKGYITAAERRGEVLKDFDFGNSPYAFMNKDLKGKTIILTTSNGTRTLKRASEASQVVVGCFLNFSVLQHYLLELNRSVILLCAGWRNRVNLEDSLFAGAMAHKLKSHFRVYCDAARMVETVYQARKNNFREFLKKSSHAHRLKHLNIEKDVNYCLQWDRTQVVPVMKKDFLIAMEKEPPVSL